MNTILKRVGTFDYRILALGLGFWPVCENVKILILYPIPPSLGKNAYSLQKSSDMEIIENMKWSFSKFTIIYIMITEFLGD